MTRTPRSRSLPLSLPLSVTLSLGLGFALLVPAATPSVATPTSATPPVTCPTDTSCRADVDGDGIEDSLDGCPTVASGNPTGCPSAQRRARLRWLDGRGRLEARITSPVDACASRARIKLWRVRSGADEKAGSEDASAAGRRRFRVARGARYYVTVSPSYASGVAECDRAVSRTVRAPRRG